MHPPRDSGGFRRLPDTVARAMNPLPAITKLVLTRLRWVFATGDQRDAEILALRHQLLVLQRQIDRAQFTETDRTILAVLSGVFDRRRLAEVFIIVRPATVIGWHRRLVARRWTQPPTARRGRPSIEPRVRKLVIRLAGENPNWGYRRIHGELARLGHTIAASTVWKILRAAGINPVRDRTGPTWIEFIRSQAGAIIATDFACVDSALLRRFHVLFVIEVHSRRVHLAGITTNPTGPWTTQAARNFLMRIRDDHGFRYLIRDGAGQFTKSFDTVLAGSGISVLRIPPRSPQANAFAERWVQTLRHELLDRTIIWNEKQLRALVVDYIEHYNTRRPHRGINQRAPDDTADVVQIRPGNRIERHTVCGGLINEYRTPA
jgi:putative transposase